MAETLSTRVTRLERTMQDIAEKHADLTAQHAELNGLVKVLLNAQIKTEARFQETDKRIENLVSAIGEFSRRDGKST